MTPRLFLAGAAFALLGACAHVHEAETITLEPIVVEGAGLFAKTSAYSVDETIARLEVALAARDIKIMAKVDHAANAAKVDQPLAPTTLLVFGNPKVGTQLMQASRSTGIDLPLKALVFQDGDVVTLQYNDIHYIAARHGIPDDLPILEKIAGLLDAVTTEATGAKAP